jgi:T4 RnlA family RNA ligase
MNTDELFEALMWLNQDQDSTFYFVDQTHNGIVYRIFSYRLASYTDFCKPFAREARGIMFELNKLGSALRVASRPPSKFFNYKENPFTMELDFSNCESITEKMDGSLISTYYERGELFVKSKTSLYSEQAVAAQKYLDKNTDFKNLLAQIVSAGNTVSMEYTAPTNRVVLYYPCQSLKIFNVRSNDGDDWTHDEIKNSLLGTDLDLSTYLVENIVENVDDKAAFVNSINGMTGIEGYVVNIKNSERVKIKTGWYLSLHKAKDSIGSDRRLFECVVTESHDDLKSIFSDDLITLKRIDDMEAKVKKIINEVTRTVYDFYNANRLLDRKSYAILGQSTLTLDHFGLAMMLYTGKEIDLKEWLIKRSKNFGISDVSTSDE